MDITDTIAVPDDELLFTFARSGGPGGQNVNKVASKAVLHWNLAGNASLPADVKQRLRAHEGNRITTEGALVIHGQRFRDQAKNVEDCLARLREMVLRTHRAAAAPTDEAIERVAATAFGRKEAAVPKKGKSPESDRGGLVFSAPSAQR